MRTPVLVPDHGQPFGDERCWRSAEPMQLMPYATTATTLGTTAAVHGHGLEAHDATPITDAAMYQDDFARYSSPHRSKEANAKVDLRVIGSTSLQRSAARAPGLRLGSPADT